MATKKIYYVAEEQPEAYDEAGLLTQSAAGAQPAYESEAEPRCAICHELLAWHEQACQAAPPASPPDEAPASFQEKAATRTYAYDLGHRVQPVRQAQPHTIIWRGQLKERHPQTGLVHRVNVYRLDDNFWDCYHEEELLAAA